MAKLVILPGWGGSKATWQRFIDLAQSEYDVVCVELPCFGQEPCPTSVWGVEEYADFVKKKLTEIDSTGKQDDHIDRQDTVILGHSFGGQVAAYLISHNPGFCAKLVLSGAAVIRHKITLRQLFFWPLAKLGNLLFSLPGLTWLKPLARTILYRAINSPDYVEATAIKRAIFQRITRQDVSHCLSNIGIPALVVWGEKDDHVPLRQGRRIVKLLPHGTLHIVSGGRHGLHLQDPVGLLEVLRPFINKDANREPKHADFKPVESSLE